MHTVSTLSSRVSYDTNVVLTRHQHACHRHVIVWSSLGCSYRHERPANCPDRVYRKVMMQCWQENPDKRPPFSDLIPLLEARKRSGNIFRVGIFLDFVGLTTRAPHGAHARRAERNRIARRSRMILPLLFRPLRRSTSTSRTSRSAWPPTPARSRARATARTRAVSCLGRGFFLISFGSPHVRCTPTGWVGIVLGHVVAVM